MPPVEKGSKIEVLSNQGKTAKEKRFETVTWILALLTAHGQSGQAAMPHVEEGSRVEELSNQPYMVGKPAQDLKLGSAT